jgi:hypothetical protein
VHVPKACGTTIEQIFLNCFEPDETFLQMAIVALKAIAPESVFWRSIRAFEGRPRHITDKDFSDVIGASGAFFVRKVDHANAKRLRDWIELIV